MFTPSDVQRFMAKVSLPQDVDGCWTWTAGKHSKLRGYGKFWLAGRMQNAHKAAYQLFVGPVAEGLVLGHQCNNENCVNPAHLKAESQSENIKYCVMSGRHNSQKDGRYV